MDYSLLTIILINIIVFIGSLLQGLIGYGLGMFCAPLLFLINPNLVPAPLIIISTIITIVMLYRDKGHLQFSQVRWAMLGGFFGVVLAGFVLTIASKQQFELAFGLLILVAVLVSIIGVKVKVNAKNNTIAGFTSGFMGMITAVGGPPMALLYQHGDIDQIKANLTAFFLFLNIIALITLASVNAIPSSSIIAASISLPGVGLGFYLSIKSRGLVKTNQIRHWILALSAITAVMAIYRAI